MREVTYKDAIKFLDYLQMQLPDWTYDNWDDEIEYIKEMLWQYNDLRNS